MTVDDARTVALALLLGSEARARKAVLTFESRSGWMTAVELCSTWAVLPQLQARCESLGVVLDPASRAKLHLWLNAVFLRSAVCLHHTARALAALADAAIDAAAIKGVAAIAGVYRGPRDRTIGDGDILLRPADLDAAVVVLERAGFRFQLEGTLADQMRRARKWVHDGNRCLIMCAPDGNQLDLHWELGRLSTDAILSAARPAQVYGQRLLISSDVHGFLLGVYHALRNGFVPDRIARDLLDCRAWLGTLRETSAPTTVARLAMDWGLAPPALAMVRALTHLDPNSPAASYMAALTAAMPSAERRRADALTELFTRNSDGSPWNDDFHFLLNPRYAAQTAMRWVAGRSAYPWLVRTTEAQARGAVPIGKRLVELGQSVWRTDWRLLRALKRAQISAAK